MPPWLAIMLGLISPIMIVGGFIYAFGRFKANHDAQEKSLGEVKIEMKEGFKGVGIQMVEMAKEGIERKAKLENITEKVGEMGKTIDELDVHSLKRMTSEWPKAKMDLELIKRLSSRTNIPVTKPGSYSAIGEDDPKKRR